jgi:hypothetical protein
VSAQNGNRKGRIRKASGIGYVRCSVEPGMFRGEYLVTFQIENLKKEGEKIRVQLLVDEHEIIHLSGTPERGDPAEGLLRVEVVRRDKGYALLVLPQPAQPVGERVYVEEDMVEEGAIS